MEFGTIKDRAIEIDGDAEKKTLILEVQVSDADDGQSVEFHATAGDDVQPPDGARVFIAEISESFQIAVVIDDGIEPDETIEPGEREIYASDDGARKSKIRWKKDGQLVLNDGEDTAVNFTGLKAAFDTLRDDFNNFLSTVFTPHLHKDSLKAETTPTTSVAVPSAANIDPAESETINLP
jgi:hypothetical protein